MITKYKTTVVTPTHTTYVVIQNGGEPGPEITLTNAEFEVAVARMRQASSPDRRFELDTLSAHVPGDPGLKLPPQASTASAPADTANPNAPTPATEQPKPKE